jgi:putative transposase
MPRQARLVLPDVALHVIQRGHNRQACFRHETDHLVYLTLLHDLSRKSGCALHAYCLMTNHVHLLLTPSAPTACSTLIRDLGQRYVQYFNRRYERSGTLWEGRFRSCLVDSAPYVLACYRYIELNPVRAGMVPSASAYRWSSHHGNTGRTDNNLLSPHAEYLALSNDEVLRRSAYQQLCGQGDDPAFLTAIREATSGGFPLLGEKLKAQVAAMGRQLEPRKPGPLPARPDSNRDLLSGELGF